jgi:hypothetical protein
VIYLENGRVEFEGEIEEFKKSENYREKERVIFIKK